MILVDRAGRVVAASAVSGFSEGLGINEQTSTLERETLEPFDSTLARSDFWSRKANRADYSFHAEDGPRQAVATPISIRGKIFTLIKKAH